MRYLLLIPILLPIIGGTSIFLFRFQNRKARSWYILSLLIVNSVLVWGLALGSFQETLLLAQFAQNLQLTFFIDGPAKVFSCLVATLWIPASIYAFEYMEHEKVTLSRSEGWLNSFFAFYTITYGVTLGLAYSGNPLTMYVFFEALTLITLPLVIALQNNKSINAGRRYLRYMLGGAAFGFITLVFLIMYGDSTVFTSKGMIDFAMHSDQKDLLLLVFVVGFCGFGVKAALFPFGRWLISAAVAPTPVTALLHAVAVVKSGAFVLIRLTYYCFGADQLRGTWAQYVVLIIVAVTVVYGSTMAVKETHIKRRLAYSTMSNLSYILLGVVMMSPAGIVAAFSHLVFHAFMKINSFFCAGVMIQRGERVYVDELNGIGREMPLVTGCFTIAAISLTGIPPLAGFVSKWQIADSILGSGDPALYIGLAALLYAALMTAVYMLTMVIRAWFPPKGSAVIGLARQKQNWYFCGPLVFFTVIVIAFGFTAQPLISFFMTFI